MMTRCDSSWCEGNGAVLCCWSNDAPGFKRPVWRSHHCCFHEANRQGQGVLALLPSAVLDVTGDGNVGVPVLALS